MASSLKKILTDQGVSQEDQEKVFAILDAPATEEEKKDLLELAEWDWVTASRGDVLHHLRSFSDLDQAAKDWGGPGVTSCGRRCRWLSIPGIFSRMGRRRCTCCCKRIGIPTGTGSPKNDDALRPLVKERIDAL